jgi:hypothetical protein
MAPHQAGVEAIHPTQIRFRGCFEHPELCRAPLPSQVNSKMPVLCESVSNPVGTRPVFHYDNDTAVVVEVPNRNAVTLARVPPNRFDDEGVLPRVRGSRYAGDDRSVRDGVRYSNYGSRKSH